MHEKYNAAQEVQEAQEAQEFILTKREHQIIVLVARGFSDEEIAKYLTISTRTVNMHVGNIREKLGAKNRTQAVVEAIKNGLLTLTEI